jgi:uncharacterized protein (DUF2141 family)
MRAALGRTATFVALALASAPLAWSQTPPVANDRLIMVIGGLRNDTGTVRVGLYNDASRFPRAGQNWRFCNAPIHARRAVCEIPDVPPGVYAVALTHDENNNGHFDQGFLGWPLEGYGFSNNVHPHLLGPPGWDAARFVFRGGAPMTISMSMQY